MELMTNAVARQTGIMVALDDRCMPGSANSKERKDAIKEHRIILARACREGYVAMVEQLLSAGVDHGTTFLNEGLRLPLVEAASGKHTDCVSALLDAGASPCAYDCAT